MVEIETLHSPVSNESREAEAQASSQSTSATPNVSLRSYSIKRGPSRLGGSQYPYRFSHIYKLSNCSTLYSYPTRLLLAAMFPKSITVVFVLSALLFAPGVFSKPMPASPSGLAQRSSKHVDVASSAMKVIGNPQAHAGTVRRTKAAARDEFEGDESLEEEEGDRIEEEEDHQDEMEEHEDDNNDEEDGGFSPPEDEFKNPQLSADDSKTRENAKLAMNKLMQNFDEQFKKAMSKMDNSVATDDADQNMADIPDTSIVI